jgi:hypothetical protein
MIKKWVFAGLAYLLVVMVGFGIYNSTVKPEPKSQQEENHELDSQHE